MKRLYIAPILIAAALSQAPAQASDAPELKQKYLEKMQTLAFMGGMAEMCAIRTSIWELLVRQSSLLIAPGGTYSDVGKDLKVVVAEQYEGGKQFFRPNNCPSLKRSELTPTNLAKVEVFLEELNADYESTKRRQELGYEVMKTAMPLMLEFLARRSGVLR